MDEKKEKISIVVTADLKFIITINEQALTLETRELDRLISRLQCALAYAKNEHLKNRKSK